MKLYDKEFITNSILDFLSVFPKMYNTGRGKKNKKIYDESSTDKKIEIIKDRIKSSTERIYRPSIPPTVPDPVVSLVLEKYYEIENSKINEVSHEHKLSMAAENKVGEYLELFIAHHGCEDKSWVHCVDGMINKVDFIKKENSKWILLQVKNRSNSENSSSSEIRQYIKNNDNIEIEKWHRVNAYTGKTNWDKFPDSNFKDYLSEKKFHIFVNKYLSDIKINK